MRSHRLLVLLGLPCVLAACGGDGGGDGGGGGTPAAAFTTTTVAHGGSAGTSAVAMSDVNADGRVDLLATHENEDTLTVQLGTGATFGAAGTVAVGDGPTAIVTGDFNLDGRVDVAVSHDAGDSVLILTGNGDGTFAAGATLALPAGAQASAVVAADLNADGKLDLAVSQEGSADASVLLGNGDGSFAAAAAVALGAGHQATAVVAADFDEDGRLDLAASSGANGSVAVVFGQAGGTFSAATVLVVEGGADLSDLAAADLNLDGRVDLIVANRTSGEVEILLGNGNGTFAAAVDHAVGADASALAVADFDIDGALDVAVALEATGQVVVAYGQNDGTVGGNATFSAGGTGSVDVVLGDADRNASLDAAVANSVSGNVGILFGASHEDPAVSLGAAATLAVTATAQTDDVLLVDLNGDGSLDVVASNEFDSTTSLMVGAGDGTFGGAANVSVGLALGPTDVAAGDVNADGRLDVVAANSLGSNVSILLGTALGLNLSGNVLLGLGAEASAVVLADLDHDGDLDVVVANAGTANVSVALGNGDGTFGAATSFAVTAGFQASAMVAGDFNMDGDVDIALSAEGTGTVAVMLGNGAGGFGAAATFPVEAGANLTAIATADVNRDGRLDLVVANGTSGEVSILLGTGFGTFGAAADFAVGVGVSGVAVTDLDHDGRLDLAVSLAGSGQVALLFGTGTGTFGAATTFAGSGTGTAAVAVGDVNADGSVDVALANRTSGSVSVLLGN